MSTPDTSTALPSNEHRAALEREIASAESILRRLEAEQAETRARLSGLKHELAALGLAAVSTPEPTPPPARVPRTPDDKVQLFRQLFRGRPLLRELLEERFEIGRIQDLSTVVLHLRRPRQGGSAQKTLEQEQRAGEPKRLPPLVK